MTFEEYRQEVIRQQRDASRTATTEDVSRARGYDKLPGDDERVEITVDVLLERERQIEKWGVQNHPGVDQSEGFRSLALQAKELCQQANIDTWPKILMEEIGEAFELPEGPEQRKELVQLRGGDRCVDRGDRSESCDMSEVSKQFEESTADHQLRILRDDGVYRHVEMRKSNGSSVCMFGVVTWPGHLAYYGDMGDFIFRRLNDMFEFFRGDREPNFGYWAEKVQTGVTEEWSPELFREYVEETVEGWTEHPKLNQQELREAASEILSMIDDGEYECRRIARDFDFYGINPFENSWEHTFTRWTYHYEWACYAIQRLVREYDAVKEGGDCNV